MVRPHYGRVGYERMRSWFISFLEKQILGGEGGKKVPCLSPRVIAMSVPELWSNAMSRVRGSAIVTVYVNVHDSCYR